MKKPYRKKYTQSDRILIPVISIILICLAQLDIVSWLVPAGFILSACLLVLGGILTIAVLFFRTFNDDNDEPI